MTGPSSCFRNQTLEVSLKRTKIALALPGLGQQRLSNIGRGWCPSLARKLERVIRSDTGAAHRLLVSGRVLSATTPQVKAYRSRSVLPSILGKSHSTRVFRSVATMGRSSSQNSMTPTPDIERCIANDIPRTIRQAPAIANRPGTDSLARTAGEFGYSPTTVAGSHLFQAFIPMSTTMRSPLR